MVRWWISAVLLASLSISKANILDVLFFFESENWNLELRVSDACECCHA
jgi:hypothetical protein